MILKALVAVAVLLTLGVISCVILAGVLPLTGDQQGALILGAAGIGFLDLIAILVLWSETD